MVIFETKEFVMTKIYKKSYALLAIMVLFLSLTGCHASASIGNTFQGVVQLIK